MTIKKALIVVAHPDDEVLGCGGFICKMKDAGVDVKVLFMNRGYRERIEANGVIDYETECENQIKESAKHLGFDYVFPTRDFEASKFDCYRINMFTDEITKVIKGFQPDTIITHSEKDLHQDHIIVNKATLISSRYKLNSGIRTVITFATISSSEIDPNFDFKANLYVDISNYLSRKKLAMKSYVFESDDYSRGDLAIDIHSQYHSLFTENKKESEAFEIKRACI
jgi:LmbE family N-acetylglucosaminyl deacetylase